jgi:predicted DNA-binding transcriptional regulator AlpA
MALILKKKESGFRNWYEKNKERLSAQRKKRYAEDAEYRQRALETSRRRRRGEPTPMMPPDDATISFRQAAERTGVSVSTLHEWRRKKLFPEPKHHNRGLWFSEKQVLLLKNLKEFFRVNGRKPSHIKLDRLKEVVAFISSNWE